MIPRIGCFVQDPSDESLYLIKSLRYSNAQLIPCTANGTPLYDDDIEEVPIYELRASWRQYTTWPPVRRGRPGKPHEGLNMGNLRVKLTSRLDKGLTLAEAIQDVGTTPELAVKALHLGAKNAIPPFLISIGDYAHVIQSARPRTCRTMLALTH